MTPFTSSIVEEKFNSYPDDMRKKLLELRELVYEVANNEESIENIEETLKWNEPSFITQYGSPLRVNWKKSKPYQYSMYFNQKIGTRLMLWIYDYAKQNDCIASELNCYIGNQQAHRFWEKEGYEVITSHFQKKLNKV